MKKIRILRGTLLVTLALAAYLVLPNHLGKYMMTVMNSALIYFVVCLGIQVILGMGGMVSFAAISFMGVGAYATAIFSMRAGLPILLSVAGAMVISALFALLIGMVLLRLKGTFFTFSTVALVQITYSVFNNWRAVTGGPDGIAGVPNFSIGGLQAKTSDQNYLVLLTAAILCALVVVRLRKTNLGRALSSVRDNEIAAQVMGVNVYKTKVTAFVIAAFFAGLGGALMTHTNHFVGASSFTFDQSTTFVIMAMLGGVTSTPGVFVGTLLITMLPEWLKPLQEYIRLFYGLGVMLLMVFMPMGLAGLYRKIAGQVRERLHLGYKTRIGAGGQAEV